MCNNQYFETHKVPLYVYTYPEYRKVLCLFFLYYFV